jgi:SAM-dependent methyltransferase
MPELLRPALLHTARLLGRLRDGLLYFAAGTMPLDRLRAYIAGSWAGYNTTDNEINAGLFGWEKVLFDRHIKPSDRVFLVGCGGGRDLIPLEALGCRVTALDPCEQAIRKARQVAVDHHLGSTIVEGFFEDVVVDGVFDVFLFSNLCICFIPESSRRIAVLRKARAHLAPGGRIIASTVFRERPPRGRPIRIGRIAGMLSRSDWRIEEGDLFHCPGSRPLVLHYEHIFGPGEFEKEGAAAGLRVSARCGHTHEEPFIVFTPA